MASWQIMPHFIRCEVCILSHLRCQRPAPELRDLQCSQPSVYGLAKQDWVSEVILNSVLYHTHLLESTYSHRLPMAMFNHDLKSGGRTCSSLFVFFPPCSSFCSTRMHEVRAVQYALLRNAAIRNCKFHGMAARGTCIGIG